MTQRLKNREIVPPDSFRYTVRETGYTVRARDWWTWMQKIKAHLRANDIPIPVDIEDQASSQLCEQLPPEYCERPNSTPWVNTRLKFGEIVDGAKVYISALLGRVDFVDQVEAERRAYVCSGCFLNVATEGCGTCHKLAGIITGDVAKRSTPYDPDLKACAACKCPLPSLVHFPLDVLEKHDASLPFPDFCWRNRQSSNYRPQTELATA